MASGATDVLDEGGLADPGADDVTIEGVGKPGRAPVATFGLHNG